MFEGMRNRVWLTRIAQRTCLSSLKSLDDRAFGLMLREFEQHLRAKGLWPCDSPEVLELFFNAWFYKRLEPEIATQIPVKPEATTPPSKSSEPPSPPSKPSETPSPPPAPGQVEQRPTLRRNELCPCGSGVRYKHCCGRVR